MPAKKSSKSMCCFVFQQSFYKTESASQKQSTHAEQTFSKSDKTPRLLHEAKAEIMVNRILVHTNNSTKAGPFTFFERSVDLHLAPSALQTDIFFLFSLTFCNSLCLNVPLKSLAVLKGKGFSEAAESSV